MPRAIPIAALLTVWSLCSSPAHGAETDLSTPRKAAIEFAKALETCDMAAVEAASVGSDDDLKVVQMIGQMVRSARDLRNAAIDRFGDAGKQVLPSADDLADFSKRMEGGTEKIEGDTATLGTPNQPEPMKLRKTTDGRWRVDLGALPDKDEIRRMMPAVQKVFMTATADIRAGKYASLDRARDMIGQQMFATIAQPASTQPAAGDPNK